MVVALGVCISYKMKRVLEVKKMDFIIQHDELSIRYLQKGDELFLLKWLTDQQVLAYYEGRDRPYTREKVLEDFFLEDDEVRCLVLFNDIPIGYIQFYLLAEVEGIKLPDQSYGMDQFIGETSYWNKNIGKKLIRSVVNFIERTLKGSLVLMDPQHWNKRAIRCYQQVGFANLGILPKHELHEGSWNDCILMAYDFAGYRIVPINPCNREALSRLFVQLWGSTEMVISTGTYILHELDGFLAYDSNGEIIGVATYRLYEDHVEIISLDSLIEKEGIGGRLLMRIELVAVENGCSEMKVITTNDNISAFEFYQRKRYRMIGVARGAVDLARQVKPEIPLIGHQNIPIHDEILLSKKLSSNKQRN